jgi:hypothetical protein
VGNAARDPNRPILGQLGVNQLDVTVVGRVMRVSEDEGRLKGDSRPLPAPCPW